MGFFNKDDIEKGLFGLANAAIKGAEKAAELAKAAADSNLGQAAASKLKQAQVAAAPHLQNLQDRATTGLQDLQVRAAPHLDNLKTKANEIAADVKEAVVGPDYTKLTTENLVNLYTSNAVRLDHLAKATILEGFPINLVVDPISNTVNVLKAETNGQPYSSTLNKVDTIGLSSAQRNLALDVINLADEQNKIVAAVRAKEPNLKWPNVKDIVAKSQIDITTNSDSPSM